MSHLDDEELREKLDALWGVYLRDPHGPHTRMKRVARRMSAAAGTAGGAYLLGQAMKLVNMRHGSIAATTGLGVAVMNVARAGYEEYHADAPEMEEHQREWDLEDWVTHGALLDHYRREARRRPSFAQDHPALRDEPDDLTEGAKNIALTGGALGYGFYTQLPRYGEQIARHRRYHDASRMAQYGGVLLDEALDWVQDQSEPYLNPIRDPQYGYDVDDDDEMAEFAPPPSQVPRAPDVEYND